MEKIIIGGAVDRTQKVGHIVVSAAMAQTANLDSHHLNSKIIEDNSQIGTKISKKNFLS